ncbi:hypothetical protein HDU82_006968 [Entophlyctis luteolus]|nr:hypothetical protein HDU82_006968 [Entophlyctis luteolus]
MKVVVAGGAGYIGSHVVRELLRTQKYEIVILDDLSTGHKESVPAGVPLEVGNIKDRAFLDSVFAKHKPDAVFVSYTVVAGLLSDPLSYYENNVSGTVTLLQAMVAHEIKAHDLKYVCLRYFNACGADASGEIGEDHADETHLIPLILQVPMDKREKIYIFGDDYNTPDGTCIRDYVHVSDIARAHIYSIEHMVKTGVSNQFNLGSGKGYSVKEIVDAARKVTGHAIPAEIKARRPGDPDALVAASAKAEEVLGWKRKYLSIEDIVASAWKWHLSHPHGYSA